MKEKKKYQVYSEEFNWRIVQEVLSGHMNKEDARKAYGIASNCAILYWMRSFSGVKEYRLGGNFDQRTYMMKKSKKEQALSQQFEQ